MLGACSVAASAHGSICCVELRVRLQPLVDPPDRGADDLARLGLERCHAASSDDVELFGHDRARPPRAAEPAMRFARAAFGPSALHPLVHDVGEALEVMFRPASDDMR